MNKEYEQLLDTLEANGAETYNRKQTVTEEGNAFRELKELEKLKAETIHESRVIVSNVHAGPFFRIKRALQFRVRARAAVYDIILPFPVGKHNLIIFRYTHSGRYIDSPAKWPQELEIDRFQIWKQAIDKWLD